MRHQLTADDYSAVARDKRLAQRLAQRTEQMQSREPLVVEGVLRRTVGLTLEAEGCRAALGSHCEVIGDTGRRVNAEVVGFPVSACFLCQQKSYTEFRQTPA